MNVRRPQILLPALLLAMTLGVPAVSQAQQAKPRIIAGSDVSISTYPFQIALYQGGSFICGGSIRDATHVVTAAHCVTSGPAAPHVPYPAAGFQVRYGSDVRGSSQLRAGVSAVSIPTQYTRPSPDESYDVAVLTLSTPIDLSGPNAKAIPFANPSQVKGQGTGVVTGWGDTAYQGSPSATLKGTRVPLRGDSACTDYYGSYYVAARGVCAGGGALEQNPDTCQGDSGGPLVVDVDGDPAVTSFALLGVTSYGDGCGFRGVPAVYTWTQGTGVAAFLDAPSFQTTSVRAGGDTDTGTPGARTGSAPAATAGSAAVPPVAPPVPPPAAPAARDTARPVARLSRISCTRKRRCSVRVRASDSSGRVAKLSARVERRVGRRTLRRTLRAKRIQGGFAASATLRKGVYKLTFVATDAAGNRSKVGSRRFRVR